MEKNNTAASREYPLLTWETLDRLERKTKARRITPTECELIDHYLTSIGYEGRLLELLEEEDVFSFEDISEALTKRYPFDLKPPSVAGYILGGIHALMERVEAGDQIY